MRIIKFVVTIVCALVLLGKYAYSDIVSVTTTPIDFGVANYLYDSSGYNVITINTNISTSGSGYFISHTGATKGSITLSGLKKGKLVINMSEDSFEFDDIGCGKVTISNVNTDGQSTYSTNPNTSVTIPVGATLTFDRVDATSPCVITGTIANAFEYRYKGDTVNESLNFTVQIIPNMGITHNSSVSLNFGSICSADSQQSITIAPDGTVSGNNVCPTVGTSADAFTVTGNAGQIFSVNLPSSVTITSGSNTLTVSNLTSSCSNNCTLIANTYSLNIGGTLSVPSRAPIGDYAGTYSVSITY